MKMIAGALSRASLNRRRIRAAPRPANISMNEDADWLKNCAPGLVGDRLGEQGLAGSGWAVQKDPLRHRRPELLEALRVGEEVDDLAKLVLGLVHAGDVVPGDGALRLGLISCGLVRGISFSIRHMK